MSEGDGNALQETQFLESVHGMTEAIIRGMETPIEECVPEDMVWLCCEEVC